MENKLPDTSLEAYDKVTPEQLRDIYIRIKNALIVLGKANYDTIAKYLRLSDINMVSRRTAEMERLKIIYKPGTKSLTSRNRNAYDYSLTGTEVTIFTLPERYVKGETTAADYASQIIAKTKTGKAIQADLFNNEK